MKFIVTLYNTKHDRKETYSTDANSTSELMDGLTLLTDNGYEVIEVAEG